MRVELTLNGSAVQRDVASERLLVDLLREDLGLIGTHVGCNNGICGSCTVLVDGLAVRACLLLAVQADGASVTTIEGLAGDPLQSAFVERGAVQCGFCIPGMIVAARGLLNEHQHADRDQIVAALEGNLCRCTGYVKIVQAVAAAAST
jgi:aerobic carbon-monoxide dehydrogenase small subunit